MNYDISCVTCGGVDDLEGWNCRKCNDQIATEVEAEDERLAAEGHTHCEICGWWDVMCGPMVPLELPDVYICPGVELRRLRAIIDEASEELEKAHQHWDADLDMKAGRGISNAHLILARAKQPTTKTGGAS